MKTWTLNLILLGVITILIGVTVTFFIKNRRTKERQFENLSINAFAGAVNKKLDRAMFCKKAKPGAFVADSYDLEIKFTIHKTASKTDSIAFNVVQDALDEPGSGALVQTVKFHMVAK